VLHACRALRSLREGSVRLRAFAEIWRCHAPAFYFAGARAARSAAFSTALLLRAAASQRAQAGAEMPLYAARHGLKQITVREQGGRARR